MIRDNETLEFLGDSILGFIISDLLFNTYSEQYTEGLMSKVKSYIISTEILSMKARDIELGTYLLLGRGEEKTGGRSKRSLLANTFEALIAAIYMDGGLEVTKDFVYRFFKQTVEDVAGKDFHFNDFKSLLQEKLQSLGEAPRTTASFSKKGRTIRKHFTWIFASATWLWPADPEARRKKPNRTPRAKRTNSFSPASSTTLWRRDVKFPAVSAQ